jgi:hypothetical protein
MAKRKYVQPVHEPTHDTTFWTIPRWLCARKDVKPEDKLLLSIILTLQDNPDNPIPGKCFASQRTLGSLVGMSINAINLAIARLSRQDRGRKTGHSAPRTSFYYNRPLLDKYTSLNPFTHKLMTTYAVSLEKDSPLWWMREHDEGRAGFEDIRTAKKHNFEPKNNRVAFPKKARKSS